MISTSVDIGPKITIEGEKQFKASIKELNSEVKLHAAQMKALSAEYEDNDNKVSYLTKKQKLLSDSVETSEKKVKALTAEYNRQTDKLEALKDRLEKAREENGENSNAAIKAENAYQKQAAAVNNLSTQLTDAQTELSNTKHQLEENAEQLDKATSKTEKLKEAYATAGEVLETAGTKMESAGEKISDIGGKLTVGITTPLVAAATAATTLATTSETSFAKVSTIFDDTAMSAEKLEDEVTAASDETGIAISDLNEALYSSVSAGIESGKALEFTTQMAKLAKGGFTDTAKAVDVVTTVINAYGKSADEAEDISNKLITTQNLGKTTVDELASSLGKVIPTAKNVNVGFDDVSTSMAVMTKNGIATAEAATYYNSMLNELGKSGTTADKALKEIAEKSFKELVAEGKPVTEILQMLSDYAADNSKSLSDMFGSAEAGKAALTIMKNDGEEYNEILAQMQDSAGATQAAFEKMDSTTAVKMQKELNKLKNIGVDVGNELLPYVTKALDYADNLLDKYDDLSDSQKELALKIGAAAAASGPALKVVGTAITKGGTLIKTVGSLGTKLAAVSGPAGPIVATAAVIAGVGVAGYKVYETYKNYKLDEEIAKQFGNITLSAAEVEDVAKRLTTTEWTMKLDAVVEAKAKLEELETDLQSGIEEIEKLNWKVSIGLELTDEEKSAYLSSVESFVQSGQEYITQQGYTISLAIDATLGGTSMGEGLATFSSAFYNESSQEMQALGEDLAALVNDSFENDCFAENKLEIEKIISQMNEIIAKIKSAEEAGQSALNAYKLTSIGEGGLTKESSIALANQAAENIEEYGKAVETAVYEVGKSLEQTSEEFLGAGFAENFVEKFNNYVTQEGLATAKEGYAEKIVGDMETVLNLIPEAYQKEMAEVGEEMNDYTDDFINTFFTEYSKRGEQAAIDSLYAIAADAPEMSEAGRKVVDEYVDSLKPQQEEFENLRDYYISIGQIPPESVVQGLEEFNTAAAASGSADAMYTQLGKAFSENPSRFEMLKKCTKAGYQIPEELAKAITMYTGYAYDATTGMWTELSQANEISAEDVCNQLNELGKEEAEKYADGLMAMFPIVYQNGKYLVDEAAQGVKDNTGLNTAARESAQGAVDTANDVTKSAVLAAPQVAQIGIDVLSPLQSAQKTLDNNPLTVTIKTVTSGASAGANIGLSVLPHATGDIITSPEISLMDEDGAEAVIPLTEKYRAQAYSLLDEVADIVQYDPFAYSASAARSVGAKSAQKAEKAAQQTVYSFGDIHSSVSTQATDPDEVSRAVVRELTRVTKQKINSARGGQK